MGFLEDMFDLNGDGRTDSIEEYFLYKMVMEDDEEDTEEHEDDETEEI